MDILSFGGIAAAVFFCNEPYRHIGMGGGGGLWPEEVASPGARRGEFPRWWRGGVSVVEDGGLAGLVR